MQKSTVRDGVRQWRQWSEEQARDALEELTASGNSTADFARRKGIAPQRVAYWKKRLAVSAAPRFVAVALPTGTSARWIEISAAGVTVRVREDLDVIQIARLVEAIGRHVSGSC